VIASGTSAELKAKVGGQTLDVRPAEPEDIDRAIALVASIVGTAPTRASRTRAHLGRRGRRVGAAGRGHPPAVREHPGHELALRLASLDEVFMALTGHTAEEKTQ